MMKKINQLFLIKNNEENSQMNSQMSSQINNQMKSQINLEINSQINNQIQSQMNSLNLNFDGKLKLIQFINNFTIYKTNKSFYLSNFKYSYIEGKCYINHLEIKKLLCLINELYSIYRKIAYVFLEILITKFKKRFHSESSKVIINKK